MLPVTPVQYSGDGRNPRIWNATNRAPLRELFNASHYMRLFRNHARCRKPCWEAHTENRVRLLEWIRHCRLMRLSNCRDYTQALEAERRELYFSCFVMNFVRIRGPFRMLLKVEVEVAIEHCRRVDLQVARVIQITRRRYAFLLLLFSTTSPPFWDRRRICSN